MNKIFFFFFFFFIVSCNTFKEDKTQLFQKEVTFLNHKSDTLSIKEVISLYKKGDFSIPVGENVFHDLENLENSWLHFNTKNLKEDYFFTIWSTYLKNSQVYINHNDSIVSLEKHERYLPLEERNTHYRLPTWKIDKKYSQTDVFIRINDSDRYATSLKLLFLNQNDFLKLIKTDGYFTIAIIVFLLILAFIIITLFITQKQHKMLWYAGYIFFVITDYMVFKGIWDNEILFSNSFLFTNLKTIAQASSIFFASMFFSKFYPFDIKTTIYKQLFQSISFISLLILLFFGLKFLINDSYFDLYWIWIVLRICVFVVIITHLILIFKKVLPIYLGVSFLVSTVFSLVHFNAEPTVNVTLLVAILIENLLYIITVLETLFVTYYIVSEIVKERLLAINLNQENLELRSNFQDTVLKMQETERNKLLSNVHDTFGGYLEALKLRLLQKNEKSPEKVKEILDAFYKDYRYLLNSLYSPKINSENFIENLVEFCEKLNQLTENNIKHQFTLDSVDLEQEKCVHIYRIISELITNAIKYSKASEIKIKIHKEEKELIILSIRDNGVGFNKASVDKNSYGLKNIKERVQQINGSINIESTKNIGTLITIKIPKDA
ncbi:MAG: signal transduction histidine kinase [Urechidicola sp.]|jgi:signal transduction histidine kinase